MDLKKLSNDDLIALQSGDLSKLSDDALMALQGRPKTTLGQDIKQGVGNVLAGGVRGAGSIGSTILAPYDMLKDALAGKGLSLESNRERRQKIDAGLQQMGAEPESGLYQAGKIGGEIAGIAGAGGVLAQGLTKVAPSAVNVAQALRTGGFSGGNLPTRIAGGTISGGASAGMVDPEEAKLGAIIGGGIAVIGEGLRIAGKFVNPERLMQSALKPSIAQQKSGEAKRAIDTLLKYGVNATQSGAEKLKDMVSSVDDEITNLIQGSNKTVSKQKVLDALNDVKQRFTNQVSPTSDVNAIENVAMDFSAHPKLSGQDIPIDLAQKLKQGTYKVLQKKYGQLGSAETEAQKALARGLKEQMALEIPEIAPLNATQSDLIKALRMVQHRAAVDANKNPVGIAGLSQSPSQLALMLADRSALAKSLMARGSNKVKNFMQDPTVLNAREAAVKITPTFATQYYED